MAATRYLCLYRMGEREGERESVDGAHHIQSRFPRTTKTTQQKPTNACTLAGLGYFVIRHRQWKQCRNGTQSILSEWMRFGGYRSPMEVMWNVFITFQSNGTWATPCCTIHFEIKLHILPHCRLECKHHNFSLNYIVCERAPRCQPQ